MRHPTTGTNPAHTGLAPIVASEGAANTALPEVEKGCGLSQVTTLVLEGPAFMIGMSYVGSMMVTKPRLFNAAASMPQVSYPIRDCPPQRVSWLSKKEINT